jgi:hypothetical protein
MKSSIHLSFARRLAVLGAMVAAGAFAASAGAVGRPPDIQDAATIQALTVIHPPDVADIASRLSVGTPDVFERYAAAHPFGAGLALSGVSRPPDVNDVASQMSTVTPDVLERYASAHPYGRGLTLSTTTLVNRPPDVQDSAQALQRNSTTAGRSQGFDSNDWAIGIGSGVGLALILGIAFAIGRQHRHKVQPA